MINQFLLGISRKTPGICFSLYYFRLLNIFPRRRLFVAFAMSPERNPRL